MKNKNLYSLISVMTSSLLLCCTIHGSGRESLSKSDQDIINNAEATDEGAGKRVKKRSQARSLQQTGKDVEKFVERASKPASYAGTIVSIGAAATGDPHAKMGAAGFKLSIEAIKALGIGIAKIITITGRYQERAQEILSNIEILLEDLQKSIDKINSLEKKRKELLVIEKPPQLIQRIGYDLLLMSELPKNGKPIKGKVYLEKLKKNDSTLKNSELKYILMQPDGKVAQGTLKINTTKDLTPEILSTFNSEILEMITKEGYTASKSESRLKQLSKSTLSIAKTAEIKVRQSADILTNDKVDREEQLKAIQAELKIENENYNEIIRLLQIILMQDTLSEIAKKLDIDGTIATLESNARFFKEAKEAQESFSKNRSKRKKQTADLEKKDATNNKDLIYYMKFQKKPTETTQELEEAYSVLETKIKELTELTKMGDALYLQKKEVQLDSEVNRAAIVALYKENDAIKSQLEVLRKLILGKDVQSPLLKEETSQREPLPKKTLSQGPGPLKKDTKQSEALSKQADARP